MKRGVAIACGFLLVLMLPALILGGREGKRHERVCARSMVPGLDDEQREKLENLMMDHRLNTIDLRAEVQKLRLMMKKEFLKSEPSRKELDKLTDEISAIQKKLQKGRVEHILNVKKILTDDQFRSFLKHHRWEGERRMGKRSMGIHRMMRGRHHQIHKGGEREREVEEVKPGQKGT